MIIIFLLNILRMKIYRIYRKNAQNSNIKGSHSTWHTFPGTTPGIFLVYIFYIYAIVHTRKIPGAVPGKVCHVGVYGPFGMWSSDLPSV